MDTIEVWGGVFHGLHRGKVGVYTHADGHTYAGAHEGAMAHGYGVLKGSVGNTYSGQFANGRSHGHAEVHWADGDVYYFLYEHGNLVHSARVDANGACYYDNQPCGADHADFAALKDAAQQATVRTCPYPHPTQCPRRRPYPDARAVRFSHCARFWCLASARGTRRAGACGCVCG